MKKVLFGLLLLVSFGAQAAETSLSVGAVHNRVSGADGSIVRISTSEGPVAVGLQSETVANVSRNQADVNFGLIDVAGITGTVGLGGVTKTGVKTHAVYLGKVGYVYDFGNSFKAGASLAYRNDFDSLILDRKTTFGVKASYAMNQKTSFGLAYDRGYGDSKTNIYSLTASRKF